MCFHLSVDEVDGSGFGPVPSRLRYALVHQETHHGIAQRPTQLFGHLDHGLPGAVQRARYMSLETMAPLSDNPTVSLPAIAA